jgi:ribosomal protein L31E
MIQKEVGYHNSVIVAQAAWIWSILMPFWTLAQFGLVFSIISAFIPPKDTIIGNAEKAADAEQQVVILEQRTIDILNNERIRALGAIRMLQRTSSLTTSEHNTDSITVQIQIDSLRSKLEKRTERTMKELLQHARAHAKAETRLHIINSGINEAQGKEGKELIIWMHEQVEKERARATEDPPDDLLDSTGNSKVESEPTCPCLIQ